MKRCSGCMEICNDIVCPHCGYIHGMPPKERFHLNPGTVLFGKYTIGKVLGYGGFGVTYIGWDNILERKIAIKEFLPGHLATRASGSSFVSVYRGEPENHFMAGLDRFTKEAQILAGLNGTAGIVGICDTFIENNTAYIVMELLEGKTLKEVLEEEKTLPFERANEIIKSVLTALKRVHATGIIHRDISPGNIFITNSGEVKLIDFGTSRYAAASDSSRTLSVILNCHYAPPEQYNSNGIQGTWSDIYAVAATYYKMLTGTSVPPAMNRITNDTISPPSALGAVLPNFAEKAIMNALVVDITKRTQSADEFLSQLDKSNSKRISSIPLWFKITFPVLLVAIIAAAVVFLPALNNKVSFDTFVTANEVLVPNIVNKTEIEARKELGGFLFFKPYLEFEILDSQESETVEAGKILSQEPAAGSFLPRGGVIEVIISAGKPASKGEMPYVVARTEAEARKTLENLGFTVKTEKAYSDTFREGLVISQSVKVGSGDKNKTEVTLIVSAGKEPESVKDEPVHEPVHEPVKDEPVHEPVKEEHEPVKEEPKTNNTQKSNNKKKSSQQKSNSSNSTNNSTTPPPATENKLTETTPANTSKTESIKNDSVKENNTKNETTKTQTPKTETPKTENPETETPETDTPKTETPKTEAEVYSTMPSVFGI